MTSHKPSPTPRTTSQANPSGKAAGARLPDPSPAESASHYQTVALVLQGGGAQETYRCGVYEALHEAGSRPDWFVGTSIGAIHAAIRAGNPPERRVARLREFWDAICEPAGAGIRHGHVGACPAGLESSQPGAG